MRMDPDYRTVILTEAERNVVSDPVEQERLTKLLDMAFWHKQVGNTNSALLACEAALVINPDSTTAHSLLGSLYEKRGDYQKAIEHVERVVVLTPRNPMEQARLDQLREDSNRKEHSGGGLLRSIASRPAPDRASGAENRTLPALLAVTVVAVVIIVGLVIFHKPVGTTGANGYSVSVPGPGPGTGDSVVGPGAATPIPTGGIASATRPAAPGATAPSVVAMPRAGTFPGETATARTVPSSGIDPFSIGTSPASQAGTAKKPVSAHSLGGDKVRPLPPIAVDGAGTLVPPAPVTVSTTQGSNITALPQHTVVIQNLPDQPVAPAPGATTVVGPGVPIPHIHIVVDTGSGDSSNTSTGESNSITFSPNRQVTEDTADGYQERALVLQQQGDFSNAAVAYSKAIHLFNSQITSDRDVDTARRALRACETGLKICQESQ